MDPDDGPFVKPPIDLTTGLLNVTNCGVTDSIVFTVIAASCNVFTDAAVLHFNVVAATQFVASHLKTDVRSNFMFSLA